MTTAQTGPEIAKRTLDALFNKPGRQELRVSSGRQFPSLHLGAWGPPKKGKSHIGLAARTSEVRLQGKMDGFTEVEPGKILIPSKPLRIAYANMDRSPDTVINQLEKDSLPIIHEALYENEDGDPLIAPDRATIKALERRLVTFFDEVEPFARTGEVDLFFLDGGTIIWDLIRLGELDLSNIKPGGTTPEGEERYLPRQYAPANAEMKMTVAQRIYGFPCHTYMTQETGQVWKGQNEPLKSANDPFADPQTEIVMRPDGWNKMGHYLDMSCMVKLSNTQMGPERRAVVDMATNAAIIGKTFNDPTFAKLYTANFLSPLLKQEDQEEFRSLEKKHEGKLMWSD